MLRHVNRFTIMNKNTLHILSVIAAFLFAIHYYKLDKKCFFEVFGGGIFYSLILLILPFLWNQWLYKELTKDTKSPISYTMFVNIGNFVYIGLILFAIFMILTDYRPLDYIEGIC